MQAIPPLFCKPAAGQQSTILFSKFYQELQGNISFRSLNLKTDLPLIVANLHRLAMESKPIKIELKDYGSFPSHTIFINVTSKVPFQTLAKHIRSEAQKLMKFDDDNKPHFFMEPFIPIAQKIPQHIYEKAWTEYSHRHFTGKFIADSMLLLKRPKGEMGYKIVERFQFENLLVGVSQGDLFG